jgi:hypothetical protein
MTGDASARRDMRLWIAGAILLGLLSIASLAAAVHFWPNHNSDSTDKQAGSPGLLAHAEIAPEPPVAAIDPEMLRRQAWDKIARHLAPADAASLSAIDGALTPIEEFFAHRRAGARPFAESVLSLRGKWKYVKTRGIFGGESGEHLAFLDEKFREHLFDPDELKTIVQQSIADYLRTVQSIENKLLVTVRSELDQLDPQIDSAIAGIGTPEALAATYQQMLEDLVRDVTHGARADLGLFVGSFVAAEVSEQLMIRLGRAIATRLGVSAGVLGAGASGGAASAGATVGLAIVIDMGIEWLLSLSGSDATSQVTARVEASLDNLQELILEGDPTAVAAYHKIRARCDSFPTEEGRAKIRAALDDIETKGDLGLRRMLLRLHDERARLREAVLRKLVLEGESI